ncbi:MAG: hypothetical protein KGJ77_11725, partial [Acidobacteriota bacterium]|nr:hypothetical protein [Acidobacteriota bacterium]
MGEGGRFGFGEYPDDLGDDTAGAEPLRGWIAPEDRLWRHPSEMAASSPAPGPARRGARSSGRWSALAAGALGAAAVASAAVGVTGGSSAPGAGGRIAATDTSLVTAPAAAAGNTPSVTVGSDVAGVVAATEASLVTLLPQGASSPRPSTGVVLPGGDLVLTAASALGGATSVVVETANGGRQEGAVEGVDSGAGVAVVRVPQRIPAATFGQEQVTPHPLVVAICRCSGAAGSPPWAVTMVHQVGPAATLDGGPALVD